MIEKRGSIPVRATRSENHGQIVTEEKISQVFKVKNDPFNSEGGIISNGADVFAKITINDERPEDIIISTTVPNLWFGKGTYVKVNTAFNLKRGTTKVQSIEIGVSTNSSVDMTIKKDIPTLKNKSVIYDH